MSVRTSTRYPNNDMTRVIEKAVAIQTTKIDRARPATGNIGTRGSKPAFLTGWRPALVDHDCHPATRPHESVQIATVIKIPQCNRAAILSASTCAPV
jgi:hypothetical protein